MKKTVHIISHTHWDREWYLNSKFVNPWLPVFFESLFAMLDREPEYRFVLDGQTSMLDDCYEELKKNGCSVDAFKNRIRKFAEEGRIILGPYYLQPDWQLVSEEALVRNMLYGKEITQEFGGRTSTGWLLDNFGQIAQAPQIHRQFGMKGIVVWRGVEFEPERLQSEFYWKSPDGTTLPCVYLLSSYRNAMRLADHPASIYGRIRNEAEKIEPFAATGNVLLMNGYDQEMNPDDILPYIREGKADFGDFKVIQSTPDEYMDAVRKELKNVQIFSGALYSGRYISVFPGILSCRMYLKLKNDSVQRRMEHYAEPLNVMGAFAGKEYPREDLDAAWKLLLKNHPHDSICGVSVDDVHTNMEDRFDEVLSKLDSCMNPAVKYLVSAADTRAFGETRAFVEARALFQVFNTVPRERICKVFLPCENGISYEVKDAAGKSYQSQRTQEGVMVKVLLPAFGYSVLGLYSFGEEKEIEEAASNKELPVMENEFMQVSFGQNGSICLKDKTNHKIYENLGYLEDCADCGDEYNFSYLQGEIPRTTLEEQAEITMVETGCLRTVVRVRYRWKLPAGLSSKRDKRDSQEEVLPITTFVTLEQDSPVLRFRTILRNRSRDHRIRVLFPTGIRTEESYAQTQFDITRHPIVPDSFDNSDIREEVKRIIIGARESEPITQFPQREFAAVTDGACGAAVFNRGLPEYEVLPEKTTIALTLFRSVGWLARVDLNTRIGDAGPEIFTPDAQCLRDMEFHYAFTSFAGPVEDAVLIEKATEINQPALVVKTGLHTGNLPAVKSFFSMDSRGDVKVTAIKGAQDGNGIIIRMFHGGEGEEQVNFSFSGMVEEVYEVDLAEINSLELLVKNKSLTMVLPSKKIVSIRLVLKTVSCHSEDGEVLICTPPREKEEFSQYELPVIVTEEEVHQEEARAKEAEKNYQLQYEEYKRLQTEPGGKKELAIQKMKAQALLRSSLEARLSFLFTLKKQKEVLFGRHSKAFAKVSEELEKDIKKLGDQLNLARIEKRVSEYRTDYYLQLEKEAKNGNAPVK